MKKQILIISMILLICSLSLASYITKETDFIYETGLKITEDNRKVENIIFVDIPIGIIVWSSNNLIANCTFINCSDEGILLIGSNNIIENCAFYDCCDGIELQRSSNNIFINCRFLSNTHAGIDGIKDNNNNNLFSFCLFYDSLYGCYFNESEDNKFINCTFLDNTMDVKHYG